MPDFGLSILLHLCDDIRADGGFETWENSATKRWSDQHRSAPHKAYRPNTPDKPQTYFSGHAFKALFPRQAAGDEKRLIAKKRGCFSMHADNSLVCKGKVDLVEQLSIHLTGRTCFAVAVVHLDIEQSMLSPSALISAIRSGWPKGFNGKAITKVTVGEKEFAVTGVDKFADALGLGAIRPEETTYVAYDFRQHDCDPASHPPGVDRIRFGETGHLCVERADDERLVKFGAHWADGSFDGTIPYRSVRSDLLEAILFAYIQEQGIVWFENELGEYAGDPTSAPIDDYYTRWLGFRNKYWWPQLGAAHGDAQCVYDGVREWWGLDRRYAAFNDDLEVYNAASTRKADSDLQDSIHLLTAVAVSLALAGVTATALPTVLTGEEILGLGRGEALSILYIIAIVISIGFGVLVYKMRDRLLGMISNH